MTDQNADYAPACDRCGTELFIAESKRAGRCDDCRGDDLDAQNDRSGAGS